MAVVHGPFTRLQHCGEGVEWGGDVVLSECANTKMLFPSYDCIPEKRVTDRQSEGNLVKKSRGGGGVLLSRPNLSPNFAVVCSLYTALMAMGMFSGLWFYPNTMSKLRLFLPSELLLIMNTPLPLVRLLCATPMHHKNQIMHL